MAYADRECSTRDFLPELVPKRAQGDLSWCFAEAAADLATQQVHFRVSAAALSSDFFFADPRELISLKKPAVQKYLKSHPKFLEETYASRFDTEQRRGALEDSIKIFSETSPGGNSFEILGERGLVALGGDMDQALLLANIDGLCSEEEVPTDPQKVREMMADAAMNVLDDEDKVGACVGAMHDDPTSPIVDKRARNFLKGYHQLLHSHCAPRPGPVLIPHHSGQESAQAMMNETTLTRELVASYQERLLKEMDHAIDLNKAVAIGFDAYVLKRRKPTETDPYADHAAVISGRMKVGDQCFYQLRNSWGDTCDLEEPFKSRCKNGYTWFTAEDLKRGWIFGIDYLE